VNLIVKKFLRLIPEIHRRDFTQGQGGHACRRRGDFAAGLRTFERQQRALPMSGQREATGGRNFGVFAPVPRLALDARDRVTA
jgi:hypothetical protein